VAGAHRAFGELRHDLLETAGIRRIEPAEMEDAHARTALSTSDNA